MIAKGHPDLQLSPRSVGDNMLLERCHAGDSRAWNSLVRRYQQGIFRYSYSLCHNYEEAGDITAQSLYLLYRSLQSFRGETAFSNWMFKIVRNTYLDMCVRNAHKKPLSLDACLSGEDESSFTHEIEDPNPSLETLCIERERDQLIASAINHLPLYQRRVLSMYYSESRSYEEIAEMTGMAIGTVKSRLHRARNLLRERLTPYQDILTIN